MTDVELLDHALSGDDGKWTKLHEVCRDRGTAERLARLLEQHTTAQQPAADAWVHLLPELHPGLVVNLPAK
jgi:hypothetical protein